MSERVHIGTLNDILNYDEIITSADHTGIGVASTDVVPPSGPALMIALAAGSQYEIDAFLFVDSDSAAGVNVGLAYSGSALQFGQQAMGEGGASSNVTQSNHVLGPGGGIYSAQVSVRTIVKLFGLLKTNAAGNLTVQLRKVTSGNAGCYAGSVLRARKLI